MRRSTSAKRYPPPVVWLEAAGWIAAAPLGGPLDAYEDCCDEVVDAGGMVVVAGAEA